MLLRRLWCADTIGALCMAYCTETTAQARQDFAEPVLWYFRQMEKYIPAHSKQPVETYEEYEGYPTFRAHHKLGRPASRVCPSVRQSRSLSADR
ncbi:MAG: hypothetical protein C5B58_10720 [Acidobacteria bacterium]|nr:MAG: hypothetical protein C5B58_10720 [Acidobacteriota bacterium]